MIKKLTYIFFFYLLAMALLIALAPTWWFFDLFTHFGVQFFSAALAVIGMLLYYRAYRSATMLAFIAIIVVGPAFGVSMPQPNHVRQGVIVRVLQANVNKNNISPDRLVAELQNEQPDIITLNEVNPRFVQALNDVIAPAYPFRVLAPREDYQGMAVYSKVPIDTTATTTFGFATPPVIRVTFAEPRFTLYAIHALSPIIPGWAIERDSFFDFFGKNLTHDDGGLVVTGDFNLTMFSPVMKRFMAMSQLNDSRVGFGVVPSWLPNTLLALPIDQILYRGNIVVTDMKVLPAIGSDHRPVMATMYIN